MTRHLLLVDDNSMLLRFTSQILVDAFPQVEIRAEESYAEALSAAEGWEPGVLLVDRKLPDGNGLDLLRELKGQYPAMLALVITGELLESETELADVREIIFKPFDADDLIAKVRAALESRYEALRSVEDLVNEKQRGGLHELRNHLSSLMAGIRAFEGAVLEYADENEVLCEIAKKYGGRLVSQVREVSLLINGLGSSKGDDG